MKIPVLLIALITVSCHQPAPGPVAVTNRADSLRHDSMPVPHPFFPVQGFLRGEIAQVDSTPVGIKLYQGDDKKHFQYIKPEEFDRLANEFLAPELEEHFFQSHFRETSFLDAASQSATFMYLPIDTTVDLRRVDLLTAKGDVYDKVRNVYLLRTGGAGDSAFTKKLFWNAGKSFQIITESKRTTQVVNVVWDNTNEP